MKLDIASGTSAAVPTGLWILGSIGGVHISLVDFGIATGLSALGALSYQFLKAQMTREAEAAKGVPVEKRSQLDYKTLTYACMAAPLATGLLMWVIGALGGTANSLYSIGGFYAAGAMAPQLIPLVLAMLSKVLGLVSKGNST